MNRRVAPELSGYAVRLREIEREIVRLRREQRLFRRLGFGENIKVMQIVALQVEQRECLAIVRPNASPWSHDPRVVVARKTFNLLALALGLFAGGLAAGGRMFVNRPRSVPVRRNVRLEAMPAVEVMAPRLGRAGAN